MQNSSRPCADEVVYFVLRIRDVKLVRDILSLELLKAFVVW
jgi:hypothetical protein